MYDEALVKANLVTLSDWRQALTDKLFKKTLDNKYKLRNLLPPHNAKHYNLRKECQFNPFFKTKKGFEIVLLLKNYTLLATYLLIKILFLWPS